MEKLLRKLIETPGVSGAESKIREVIRDEVEGHADDLEVDNMGNLIARKGSGSKKLMIAAHMDQIGLNVKQIDENGFIKFTKVGGVTRHSLLNQRVTIHTDDGPITGVIGMKPPHLMEDEEREKLPEIKELFIDIGAEDREQAEEKGVKVGDYITFDRDSEKMMNDFITGPAIDNRAGVAAAIEALKQYDEDYELAVVFSTQEEVGLKGAMTAAFKEDPDVALAVDTSIAGDVPGIKDHESDLETGEGVEITLLRSYGRGLITPESVKNWLISTAEENDHEYQRGVREGGGTDAAKIYLSREGIPTGSIGIPTRHIHSGTEVVSVEDAEETVKFLVDCFGALEEHF